MFEILIYSVVIFVLVSISFLFIILANKIRIENNKKKYEFELIQNKEKEEKELSDHKAWIARGFKLYEWRSEYYISWKQANYYRHDYGKTYNDRYENQGRGYFKSEEELKNWLNSKRETLTFCREL